MRTLKVLVIALLALLVVVPVVGAQGGGVWDASFTVVNLGTASATVTVDFYDETGTHPTVTQLGTSGGMITNPFTLAAGSSQEILVFLTTQLPTGHRYSVVVSADQPVAAIANLTNSIGGTQPYFNGSYSGASDEGQTSMYMPAIVWNYYGWYSHLSVQNLTNAAMNITVSIYQEQSNTVCYTYGPTSVPAFSALYLDTGTVDLSACDVNPAGDGYNGSAQVTAAGPVAAVDNQTMDSSGATQTYNGFVGGALTIYAPALYDEYYFWDSSINVQNVGTAATTVNVTYSDGATNSCALGINASCLL